MSKITTRDGAEIFYKDWGAGQPVVFSHGWPLDADAWDAQMLFLGERGHRVVAHDRRGHGRSSQTWTGNDMDTYADDLAELIDTLDLRDVVLVGHSTGGGEVARYIGRHGTERVARAVLLGAVPPLMLKTDANPNGLPIEVFDEIRGNVRANRSQFYKDLAVSFYGYNRKGAKVSQGVVDAFWLQGMLAVLGDGLHRGPPEVRRADADRAWRRRPDRPDRHLCPALREAGEGCDAEGLSRRPARSRHDARRRAQRGSARVHRVRRAPRFRSVRGRAVAHALGAAHGFSGSFDIRHSLRSDVPDPRRGRDRAAAALR